MTIKYDIRGKFGKQINERYAQKIGQQFIQYTQATSVAIGYDNRFSSPTLENALINHMPCKIVRLGLCSTPMLYFAVKKLKTDGGIMITASHNPITDNGFKLLKGNLPLCGQEIKDMLLTQCTQKNKKQELLTYKGMKKEYIDDLFIGYSYNKKLKSCGAQEIAQLLAPYMMQ